MTKKPTRLERIAYHEAGHAVAAYIKKCEMTRLSIVPKGGTLRRVCFWNPGNLEQDRERSDRTGKIIESEIVVALAGMAAESHLIGRQYWGSAAGDLRRAENLASQLKDDPWTIRPYLSWLKSYTKDLVARPRHWAAIQALAGELLKSKEMGPRKARTIVAKALRQPQRLEIWVGGRRVAMVTHEPEYEPWV